MWDVGTFSPVLDDFGHIDTRMWTEPPPGIHRLTSFVGNTVCLGIPADFSEIDPKHKVFFPKRYRTCNRMDQKGATLIGATTRAAYVCRGCPCNFGNALVKRHGAIQPGTTKTFAWTESWLPKLANTANISYISEYAVWMENWITKWSDAKQKQFSESVEFDKVVPSDRKSHGKLEFGNKLPTKSRGIQALANLATQAKYGPVFYSLQKATMKTLDRWQIPGTRIRLTGGSGKNPEQMGKWMRDCLADHPSAHFYERDGKNWDATMQKIHHNLKQKYYRKTLGNSALADGFVKFVDAGFKIRGRARFKDGIKIKYSLDGTVKSGDSDTTLGNTFINLCIAAEGAYALGLDCDIIANGDDLLVIVSGDFDEYAYMLAEASLGIKPEARKFKDYSQVEFCSSVFFPIGGDEILAIPKPGRLLSRMWWTVKPPGKKTRQGYVHSVAAGTLRLMHAMPIISTFLRKHDQGLTGEIKDIGRKHFHERTVPCDTRVVREHFALRYGISIQEQARVEAMIDLHVSATPSYLSDPALDRMMQVDLADIADRFTS